MARKIEVQIVGDASNLHKALGGITTRTSRFGRVLGTSLRAGSIAATGGLVVLGAALKEGFDDFTDGQKAAAQTSAVLKSTGGVANVTAKHVGNLANSISAMTGVDDEAIQGGENLLLTFKNIRNETGKGNDIFNQATHTITDMSVALGQDMKSSAIQVGKALNDPVKGITALQRVGVSFTDSQKKQITALVDSGHTMQAQKIILKELTSEFGGSAKAAGDTLPGQLSKLRNAFDNVASSVIARLLPPLTRFITWATPLLLRGMALIGQGIGKVAPHFAHLGNVVSNVAPSIVGALRRIWSWIQTNVIPIVQQLRAIFQHAMANIAQVVSQHGSELNRIFGRVGSLIRAVATVAIPILRFALVTVLPKAIGLAIDALDLITGAVQTVIRWFQRVAERSAGPLGAVAGFVQGIIDKVSALVGWISSIHWPSPPSWLSGGLLSHFAGGTSFAPGGMAIVGERGPELVHLPRGSRVTPNSRLAAVGGPTQVNLYLDGNLFYSAMAKADREHRRQNGGRGAFERR